MNKNHVRVSKFLSLVLRHKPETIDLELDREGWARIDDLIEKFKVPLNRPLLEKMVASNDKQRFSISEDKLYIRANQGHSIDVDLGLSPIEPTETLYHGTATRFLDSIKTAGLTPQKRQHVHLSGDEKTATVVGARHGKVVVLTVLSGPMHEEGIAFYKSENGVWLTHAVKPEFLIFPDAV